MRTKQEEIVLKEVEFDEVVTAEEDESIEHLLIEKQLDDEGKTVMLDGFPVVKRQIEDVEKFTPIINKTKGRVVAMHGRNYKLLKNKRFVELLKGVLGESFKGTIKKDLKRCTVYYYPEGQLGEDLTLNVGEGDDITLGLRFVNSYDASSSLKADFFGVRLICQNGMTATDLYDSRSIRHTIKKLDEESFRSYVETMYDNAPLEELKTVFQEAKKDKLPFQVVIEWIAGFKQKHRLTNIMTKWLIQELSDSYSEGAQISKYQIWNLMTRTLTHGHHKSNEGHLAKWKETTLEQKHSKANKVLLSTKHDDDEELIKAGQDFLQKATTMRIDGHPCATNEGTKMYLQIKQAYGRGVELLKDRYYVEPEQMTSEQSAGELVNEATVKVIADK